MTARAVPQLAGRRLMSAVVTTGHGGYERLEFRDVPIPEPGPGEVLVEVLAAGVNNVDINTRLGWYSATVAAPTAELARAAAQAAATTATTPTAEQADGGWNAPTPFPLIQGTDCCGRVVAVGAGGDPRYLELRVLVRPCMRPNGFESLETRWLGADCDGAFAEFVKVPVSEVFPVQCDWTDAELGSIPCAGGTAENQLQRVLLQPGERVLVTGASGGVGSAAVQLAKRRGAVVTAVASPHKLAQLLALGADQGIARDADLVAELGENSFDVVIDNVAGAAFPALLRVLRRGGRYVTSGAIAGPVVALDVRDLYLKDLTLLGATAWDEHVFPDLVSYISRGEIQPLVAKTFPLAQIVDAQREFLEKRHVGNIVLLPPAHSH